MGLVPFFAKSSNPWKLSEVTLAVPVALILKDGHKKLLFSYLKDTNHARPSSDPRVPS